MKTESLSYDALKAQVMAGNIEYFKRESEQYPNVQWEKALKPHIGNLINLALNLLCIDINNLAKDVPRVDKHQVSELLCYFLNLRDMTANKKPDGATPFLSEGAYEDVFKFVFKVEDRLPKLQQYTLSV